MSEDIRDLIERSSLGTPAAKALAARADPAIVAKVMRRVTSDQPGTQSSGLGEVHDAAPCRNCGHRCDWHWRGRSGCDYGPTDCDANCQEFLSPTVEDMELCQCGHRHDVHHVDAADGIEVRMACWVNNDNSSDEPDCECRGFVAAAPVAEHLDQLGRLAVAAQDAEPGQVVRVDSPPLDLSAATSAPTDGRYTPLFDGPALVVGVRTHTYITLANPHLVCLVCRQPVRRWHDGEQCGCQVGSWLVPCQHVTDVTSVCPTWGPVDGCQCDEKHEEVPLS